MKYIFFTIPLHTKPHFCFVIIHVHVQLRDWEKHDYFTCYQMLQYIITITYIYMCPNLFGNLFANWPCVDYSGRWCIWDCWIVGIELAISLNVLTKTLCSTGLVKDLHFGNIMCLLLMRVMPLGFLTMGFWYKNMFIYSVSVAVKTNCEWWIYLQ